MFLYKTTLTCHLHSAVRNGGFIRKSYNVMHPDPWAWIPSNPWTAGFGVFLNGFMKAGLRRACTGPVKKSFPLPPARADRIKIFMLNRTDWHLSCRVTWAWAATTGPHSGPSGPGIFYRISHSLVDAARKLCLQFVIYELRTWEWLGLHTIISGKTD